MIGAIIGDIIGSRFEFNNHRSKEFELFTNDTVFTDDTVCTIAIADFYLMSMRHGVTSPPRVTLSLHKWYKKYPNESYGNSFVRWISRINPMEVTEVKPYNSYGNGAAMRVSPMGDISHTIEGVMYNAEFVTAVSHNHPEGIKGAQATAVAIMMAGKGNSKQEIKDEIEKRFGYDLNFTCDEIRPTYQFNETCQETVPQAIVAFLESTSFEDAIRNAISIGGDSDTLAAITGGIAEAYYKEIPEWIFKETMKRLPYDMARVVKSFYSKHIMNNKYPKIVKMIEEYILE